MILANDIPQGRYVVAARAALHISRADLAKEAGVSVGMLSDMETGKRSPIHNNREAVLSALRARGVQFLVDDHGQMYGLGWPP